ncbi:hypothetical protein KSD_70890 [Ktedonobacter sp. SOSP1-85]|uniref:nucleotidyltransferase domain-containing protein n=1 Tax=Ktedonobacter sp. SOSP1-85 TaxID=2778367 RepID=UPI0019160110|nr:nucleotidyltransferase domain-containing protein [Ktedonobacter sp. SOSP1-85]GHO79318.1 hypothetical protein KSD_70890 [Ktedonobacter sp. SOSP1-85]
MSHTRQYTAARDALLDQVTRALQEDERFLAAWLAGSFGRGTQNQFSDLDLHVVVADAYSEALCASSWRESGRTTDKRLALFKQFGTPSVIYDAHQNAPAGGAFTYVLYAESAINIDWMLIPEVGAQREHDSLLLFDKVGIPLEKPEEPETQEERVERMSKNVSGFWMFATAGISNLVRHDFLHFHWCLLIMNLSILDVRAALQGEKLKYLGKRYSVSYATWQEQATALLRLCDEMEELMPAVVEMGGYVPFSPRTAVETRLAIVKEAMDITQR